MISEAITGEMAMAKAKENAYIDASQVPQLESLSGHALVIISFNSKLIIFALKQKSTI